MCANFEPTSRDDLTSHFDVQRPEFEYGADLYPGQDGPILVRQGVRQCELRRAAFGLLPHWAKTPAFGRRTYNARSETASRLPSFRHAWRHRQLCLIPVRRFYEPNYESGKAERWAIGRQDGQPFALAGLWEVRKDQQQRDQYSFSMLTINASDHPLMNRFHGPEDEKRSVVAVAADDYDTWLDAQSDENITDLLHGLPVDAFTAMPAPRGRRHTTEQPRLL